MFKFDPFSSLHPFQAHTKTEAVQRRGGEEGKKSAYDYKLNFEPFLLFLPRISES